MAWNETLSVYHPIRAAVRRILKEAVGVCNQSDLKRAAKALGLWKNDKIVLPDEEGPVEMLSDTALFDPNQRGRRAYDVFLAELASKLDVADAELAQRMGRHFSRYSNALDCMRSQGSGSKIWETTTNGYG